MRAGIVLPGVICAISKAIILGKDSSVFTTGEGKIVSYGNFRVDVAPLSLVQGRRSLWWRRLGFRGSGVHLFRNRDRSSYRDQAGRESGGFPDTRPRCKRGKGRSKPRAALAPPPQARTMIQHANSG